MNTWRFGWSDIGAKYAARLLGAPQLAVMGHGPAFTGVEYLMQNVGGDQGWVIISQSAPGTLHPHFPFGFNVEPD